jgi:hypothetical protein
VRTEKYTKVIMACALGLVFSGWAINAGAEPKGPNGEKCDSSETGVSHNINGKAYTCDKCVFTKCDTSGGQIGNCQKVTHYSNCVAAISSSPFGPATTKGVLQNAPMTPAPPKASVPKAPAPGGMNRQ